MSITSNKEFVLDPRYDDSDPTFCTLESDILNALDIKKATLYAHLPASRFKREGAYIVGVKLRDTSALPKDLALPTDLALPNSPASSVCSEKTKLVGAVQEDVPSVSSIKQRRIVKRVVESHITTIHDLKNMFRQDCNKMADYYNAINDNPLGNPIKKVVIPDWVKQSIWEKDYGEATTAKCAVCSNSTIRSDSFSLGHILSESRGGSSMNLANFMAICKNCNSRMGTDHLYHFAWYRYDKVLWSSYL